MLKFAVVIPAYNEVTTIRDIAARALKVCAQVIVVNDGSTDGTGAALAGLPVRVVHHERNLGKAAALWHGAEAARALGVDAVVTLDGDGQHAPEDIPRLVAAAEQNPGSIVIGARLADRAAIPRARYLANRFAVFWLSWACGQRLDDSQSGFRVYPAVLFRELAVPHDRARSFVFESEILIEAARRGHRCVMVPIAAIYPRAMRASHFRPVLDIARIARMVARKLLSRGLYPQGLYRAFFQQRQR
ncbi:MAG TPA: glycosyltransferase family 2 protein [Acidiferrobacterales bacterium]|nr:glycosyltransferase family 2 protein [Acidiferrobacterales bacterium]